MKDDKEPWFKGPPEVYCVILSKNKVLSCKNLSWFDKTKKYYTNKISICRWNKETLGDHLTFFWIEDDIDLYFKTIGIQGSVDEQGNTLILPKIDLAEYAVSKKGGFTEADDELGRLSIHYSNNDNILYTAGNNIKFSVSH